MQIKQLNVNNEVKYFRIPGMFVQMRTTECYASAKRPLYISADRATTPTP